MKFLQIRSAFEAVKGPKQKTQSKPVTSPEFVFQFYSGTKPQRVLSDGISRDPINKQSALLIAKPPWWAYPVFDEKEHLHQRSSIQKSVPQRKSDVQKSHALEPHHGRRKGQTHQVAETQKGLGKVKHQTKQERRRQEAERRLSELSWFEQWLMNG